MRFSGSLHEVVDFSRQFEIFLGKPALIVGRERKPDPVISYRYVGVMVGRLRELSYPVDKTHRSRKVVKCEAPCDDFRLKSPIAQPTDFRPYTLS